MNEKRIDLNLLVVFDAVAATGSVTAAARRLSLSQPAVSHALNRLRDHTGDPLFVRSRRGLAPTPRAEAMRAPVRDILSASAAVFASGAFAPATSDRRFRIGVSDYASLTLVPAIARACRAGAPRVRIETPSVGPATLAALESGDLDCTFWGLARPGPPWRAERLFSERLVGMMGRDHPLARRLEREGRIALDDYAAYPHVVMSPGASSASQIDLALDALGRTRTVGLVTQSFAANLGALHGTDLIASVPSRIAAEARPGLVTFALPLALADYDYSLVWHPRADADPANIWLRRLIAGVASAAGG